MVPSSALLVIGALVGSPYQVWIWLVAILLDLALVYFTSREGNWRVNSLTHAAERHGLVIILALGESVVAIGIGVAHEPVSTSIIIGSVLSVALAVGLWWVYFHHFAVKTEHAIGERTGVHRAQVVSDAYTYLHLSLVAGIVLAALGVEQAMHSIDDLHVLGLFGGCALGGGVALYIAGTGFIWRRVAGEWALIRFAGATLCVLLVPLLAVLPAIVGLAVIAAIVGLVVGAEQFFGARAKIATRAPAAA
jgi:low temperature requirement protein LtrA